MFVVYGFRIAKMFQAPSGHWANKVLHEADKQSSLFNTTTFRKQGIEMLYRHFWGCTLGVWKPKVYVVIVSERHWFQGRMPTIQKKWRDACKIMHVSHAQVFSAQVEDCLLWQTKFALIIETALAAFRHYRIWLCFQHHHRFIICDQQFRNFKCQVNNCTNSSWTSLLLGLRDNSRVFLAQVLLNKIKCFEMDDRGT